MRNSSNLIPFLLIGIFFLTAVIIGYLFLTAEEPAPVEPSPTTSEFPDGGEQEVVPVFGVQSRSGSIMQTRNFLEDEDVELVSESYDMYRIGSEQGAGGRLLYEIFYVKDGGITVSLLNEDLSFARGRAEEDLQETLDVSLLELCGMSIRVTTPLSYSEEYSGRDLGLSACPGSTQL